ncbi:protein of unknown function DUF1501 [Chthoniobacter flavus Ellin428]|uniref:DUF1501 domain-containing protein n=1 Tax=Chthoniobacter flavus Ellin428 TaxID=497964 RepID=B4D1L1_9BACT|nr:DUF1501 domain-containing protein [Chthoniobacter flavus]EDY19623.1 protein of unknown function DUF1501 [Chthoniobacter flavus Ellin428]TCO92861.1 uncharacterized protein DUF1501 [Chthoniobacter flavus]
MSAPSNFFPERAHRCRGPVSRRSFLEIGALSLLGLGMSDYLRAETLAKAVGHKLRDKAVIFIWLPGGMSHLESYDMKPDAPLEYRGILRPIKTNVSGIEVCELFPRHAQIADKFNLIRSVCHEFADHGGGHKRFLTGRLPATPTGFVNDAPAVTSIVHKKLSRADQAMPVSVAGVDNGRAGIDTFSLGAAWLGPSTTPFMVAGDPSSPDFKIQNIGLTPDMQTRLDDRVHLLEGMDRLRRDADSSGLMGAMDEFSQRAFHMLTSPQVQTAFDLSREPDSVRDRYGRHAYGQRGLMARRLVEAGCRFVTMVWENPFPGTKIPDGCTYNWDSHAVNCHMFNDCHWRMPVYDQALTALIEDLYARGLDKDVMLIATGEFGRTPRINTQVGTQTKVSQPGRDHWPNAMSMLVSGGGMRTGQVIGATNARGEYPVDRQLSPNDLWATVYRHLGIDYNDSTLDLSGRPMPILPFGSPIEEILPVS